MGEVLGLQQGQVRPRRREGRIGLALVELGLGQLDVAGADVVGQDKAGDVARQVLLLDDGAHGQGRAHDEAEFHLVVEELHVRGADDLLVRSADRAGRLAEEGGRNVSGKARILGVAAVVDHLGDHPAGVVTGGSATRSATGVPLSAEAAASRTASRSASSSAVVTALVSMRTARSSWTTHQPSAVRRTLVLMSSSLSSGPAGVRGRVRCRRAGPS